MAGRRFFAAGLIAKSRRSIQSNLKKRGLSNRALIAGIVLFAIAVTLAPPLQHYFTQKAQINSLQNQLADNQAMLEKAAKELELWDDPEYIASQARARLHFVFPGERQYIVVGNNEITQNDLEPKVSELLPIGIPWYSRLISSITSTNVNQ
ncbi:MAG: septum formation initiator family protein [Actinobacteria bacterium]|jgi:cell division protein FtsB|nr:septum formation initiator family protein [Actinomycetota bacterium]NBO51240.1 septum formation initiator family protein [Actinomycetota bacterium]NBQ59593.1 septum formation initiator family protein [Actinomycetota bacterium]NCA25540.1 septum formation initiator family protein [Actinomycetota bacterium]NCU78145.1 septum formation initiator family protein [Actinomycetota bacterium]